MSKSIKFKNNTYLDSSGIVHNKKLLNEILEDHIPKTIYTGNLHGGESVVLENPMRFLDIYFRINFSNADIFGKYTIDTILDEPTYGSCIMMASDETSGLDYYVSECMYNKSTKKLTHSRTGYFQIANNTYTSRNGSDYDYTVYRVDTHN